MDFYVSVVSLNIVNRSSGAKSWNNVGTNQNNDDYFKHKVQLSALYLTDWTQDTGLSYWSLE